MSNHNISKLIINETGKGILLNDVNNLRNRYLRTKSEDAPL